MGTGPEDKSKMAAGVDGLDASRIEGVVGCNEIWVIGDLPGKVDNGCSDVGDCSDS